MERKKILFLTDLNYGAQARTFYGAEDVYLTGRLRELYDLAICDVPRARSFEDDVDLLVVRNIGAIALFREDYHEFRRRVQEKNLNIYNEFCGIGDQVGKQYLVDFTADGHDVIPTVDRMSDIGKLGDVEKYTIKPKNGADSIGLEFLDREELMKRELADGEYVIQPMVDFQYELSFYFIDDKFEYAMYAPDKTRRWELVPYEYSDEDIEFAKKFIELSPVKRGVQRIDACRTKEGKLLLMELEDLNPYLSLDLLPEETREQFVADFVEAIDKAL